MSEKMSEFPINHHNPIEHEGSEYFDSASQPIPEEVLGVPTEPLLNLGQAMGNIALLGSDKLPVKARLAALTAEQNLRNGLPLVPLIEQVQSGVEVTPEDVRPYRKSIKRLVPQLRTADRLAKLSSIVLIGIPFRRYLNRRIEKEFPQKVSPMLDKASEYLPQAEPYVEELSSFDNPREQFVSEITFIAESIRKNAKERAVTKRRQVTDNDAAHAINDVATEILNNHEVSKTTLPMVSKFFIEKLGSKPKLPSIDLLTVVAPEIIYALESVLPEKKRDMSFYATIKENTGITRSLASTFKGTDLHMAHEVASTLLPSIRDLLPTNGQEVKRIYARISKMIQKQN